MSLELGADLIVALDHGRYIEQLCRYVIFADKYRNVLWERFT